MGWSSTEYNANNAWNVKFSTGNRGNPNKNNSNYVRPVLAFYNKLWSCKKMDAIQLSLFDDDMVNQIELDELFEAYYVCRQNKRRTYNALAFEVDFENNLVELWRDINQHKYYPGRSIAFIVDKPVLREVFAADFRDRIVHHLLINKLNYIFEKKFIEDSYSCREGKGTLYGVKKIASYMKECSENYTKDCYVLKMDIKSFFMSIDKKILFRKVRELVVENYFEADQELIIELLHKIIFNCPEKNCLIKGKRSDWKGLPKSKSLFTSDQYKGLPIGNLTSQIFANYYMSEFDDYVTKELGIKYYGRYVDDFVIIHPDKQFLIDVQPKLRKFMEEHLDLTLHPKKVYLQHYTKGVKFIGAVIKPHREYIANRTKGNLYEKMDIFNRKISKDYKGAKNSLDDVVSSINSYLGFMIHYKSFKIRRKMLQQKWSPLWKKYIKVSENMDKLEIKHKYKTNVRQIAKLRAQRRKRLNYLYKQVNG